MRPLWHFLALGLLLGALLLAAIEYAKPWQTASTPTPAQHAQAVADGWIRGLTGITRQYTALTLTKPQA